MTLQYLRQSLMQLCLKFQAMGYGDAMLNLRNKDVLSSLPLLASVLGDKYGVEVRIGGDRAATNGKVIFIPSLPIEADKDLLSLVRGYIDHESGHIRFTDHAAMIAAKMDNVTQFLWNCIEDWRIGIVLLKYILGAGRICNGFYDDSS